MPTRTRFPRRRRRTGAAAQYEVFGAAQPPWRVRWAKGAYEWLSIPFAATFLLSGKIHDAYAMSWWQKVRLAHRLYRNTQVLPTLTSYRAHLAMAAKLLGTSPKTKGVVVECGCFQGGATANLSILCDLVDRELIVYDSFEGLPPAEDSDRYAPAEGEGFLRAELDDVRANVAAPRRDRALHVPQGLVRPDAPAAHRADRARLPRRRLPGQPPHLREGALASPHQARPRLHRRVRVRRLLRPVLLRVVVAHPPRPRSARDHGRRHGRRGRPVLPRPLPRHPDAGEHEPRLHAQGPPGSVDLRAA
ncbi:MAG: hypothetical protein R2711_02175 [Acidimicrobiales bacterium]